MSTHQLPSTMKAATFIYHKDPAKAITISQNAPLPICTSPQHVLVKMECSGYNAADWRMRNGSLKMMQAKKSVMGYEGQGKVVQSQSPDFPVGTNVCGATSLKRQGTFGEYCLFKASDLAKCPTGLSSEFCGSFGAVFQTAWQMIEKMNKGMKQQSLKNRSVCVVGASGGIGSALTYLLKHYFGATVYGVSSAKNHAYLKQLGCDHCIDYKTTVFTTVLPKDLYCIYDTVGMEAPSFRQGARFMKKKRGWFVCAAGPKSPALSHIIEFMFMWQGVKFGSKCKYRLPITQPIGKHIELVYDFVLKNNHEKLFRIQTFSLDKVVEADRLGESRRAVGKICITIE